MRLNSDLPEALDHYKQSLEIYREIGNKAGEAVTYYNLAMEWERRKDFKKAISYLQRAVEIKGQTGRPDFAKNKQYLDKLIKKQPNNKKFPEE